MKYSIKVGLHVKPNNKGSATAEEVGIRLRVSWSSQRVDVRSGYVIAPEKWNDATSSVRIGAKNSHGQTAGEINRALIDLSATIEEVLTGFEYANKRVPTPAEFRSALAEATGRAPAGTAKPKKLGFFDVFDAFVSEMGVTNNWEKATYTKFGALRLHLYNFRPSLSLDTFSKVDFAEFVAYLQTKERQVNTTVSKNVGFLRWFLRWASANGFYSGAAHEQYRPRFKGLDCKEVIFLEWEELLHFLNFTFPPNRTALGAVRDVFCFCCFTGLRYSDVKKLQSSDIYRDATPPYMSVVTKKTTARLHIELNKYALSILDKYRGLLPGGAPLPVISNVKTNEHLHEAAELAGIDEPIRIVQYVGSERIEEVVPKYAVLTSHAGRRTFIVNALRLGIPAPVIMEWTGHSDYKAMKPYIKIVDAAKATNMAKFDTYEAGRSQSDSAEEDSTQKSTRKP